MSLQPLPPHVIAQIKSSIAITSLNGVVFELFKNALDAGAARVEISVDYSRGGCVIEDDGLGIPPSEFGENGGLGRLHHTSKLNSEAAIHGSQGIFLASLAALSFLSITSHHHLHHSHNSLSMHKSNYVTRQIPAPPIQHISHSDHGTRVVVRDLFGGMPVRVKQRPPISDVQLGTNNVWTELKRGLVAILLCWPNDVSITVREAGTSHKFSIRPNVPAPAPSNVLDFTKASKILIQASYITPAEVSSWIRIIASTSSLSITGAISLIPNANRNVQFISFGTHPLLLTDGKSIFYDEINSLFNNSAFGYQDESSEVNEPERVRSLEKSQYNGNGYTIKELKGGRKGVDRWPMFYINIQPATLSRTAQDLDNILDGKGKSLSAISNLLYAVIFEFLHKNHLRPRASRGRPSEKGKQTQREALIRAGHDLESVPRSQSTPPASSEGSAVIDRAMTKKRLRQQSQSVQPLLKRHLSYLDSPFDSWSRVKSGAVSSRFGQPISSHPSCEVATKSERSDSNAPDVGKDFGVDVETSTNVLVSKSGRLVKRPFAEVQNKQVNRSVNTVAPVPTNVYSSEEREEAFLWTNPVTKVTSVIDMRTGRVLPASNSTAPERISTRLAFSSAQTSCENASWLNDLLKGWENPIYKPAESPIPQAMLDQGPRSDIQNLSGRHHHHCSHLDTGPTAGSTYVFDQRISKDALQKSEIISQVDKKFILVKVPLTKPGDYSNYDSDALLLMIDQHAADERIRIEALMEELCNDLAGGEALSTQLDKPISFDISSKEISLLRKLQSHFTRWGIRFDVPRASSALDRDKVQQIIVRGLPTCIAERCRLDPKLLIEIIRTEAWKRDEEGLRHKKSSAVDESKHAWLRHIHDCPRGIIEMLNSRACRSAIMFNDELSHDMCKALVQKLALCAFPFQCAHGRPSMIPLVNIGKLGDDSDSQDGEMTGKRSFGACFNSWKRDL